MAKKKTKKRKLTVKKETLRKLDTLSSEQLKNAAGGYDFYNYQAVEYAGYYPDGNKGMGGVGGVRPPPLPTVSAGCTVG